MNESDERTLRMIQELIPDATMENLNDLKQCMNTDAVYKAGIPLGIVSAVTSYLILPKRLGGMKSVIAATTGLLSYIVGRVSYGGTVCQHKAFGHLLRARQQRHLHDHSEFTDGTNQEDQQNRPVISSNKLLEDDSSWTNFDPYLDSNVSYFDDTGSNFQEELPAEQPTDIKKNITYDDLWSQHRDSQAKEQYRDSRRRPTNREAPVAPQQSYEKSPPSKTFDTETIWS